MNLPRRAFEAFVRNYNVAVLASLVLLALLLGVLNNLRVDEEKRADWFGVQDASVAAEEDDT